MYKQYFEKKQAVIFDLDGTIVDTGFLWKTAVENILTALERPLITYEDLKGYDIYSLWDYALSNKNFDIATKFKISELVEHTHNEFIKALESLGSLEPIDGFWELAADLKQKGFKLALNTNTNASLAKLILSKLGVSQTFDVYTFGDEVKKRKPDPEIYNLTAQKLGVLPQNIIAFDNSVGGAQAAVAAKMTTFIIWDGNVRKTMYPDEVSLFVSDFTSFPGYLDKTYDELLKNSQNPS